MKVLWRIQTSEKVEGGGGGGGVGGGVSKKIFRPFGPQFFLKIRGGGWAPRAPTLDPPLKSSPNNTHKNREKWRVCVWYKNSTPPL